MPSNTSSLFLRASVVLISFAQPAISSELPVLDRGTFILTLPPEWKEVHREAPKDLPPTIAFERSGSPRGSLQVTVMWSPKDESDFASPEKVRGFCIAGQSAIKEGSVEQDLILKPISGSQGVGFFYDATDKDYKAPQGNPLPGQFPIITHGELGIDRLMMSFTIMSDAKGDIAVNEALAALQKATIKPSNSKASLTKVKGAGIELLMDLNSFVQKLGEEHFKGTYYRVGYFVSDRLALNLSILVDDLHGMSLPDLEKAGIGQSKGPSKLLPGGKVKSEQIDEPKGYLISYPGDMGATDRGYFQAQWYFETIYQGKWLELHCSKVFKIGENVQPAHEDVLRLVRSIQAPKTAQ